MINGTTTSIFDTKDQYFAFRKAFATAVRDKKSKSRVVQFGDSFKKLNGWIKPAHFLLLNILTNKPLHHGFVPKLTKSCSGHAINQSLYCACWGLNGIILTCKELIAVSERIRADPAFVARYITTSMSVVNLFLAPYHDTLSIFQLANVKVKIVEPLFWRRIPHQYHDRLFNKNLQFKELIPILTEAFQGTHLSAYDFCGDK